MSVLEPNVESDALAMTIRVTIKLLVPERKNIFFVKGVGVILKWCFGKKQDDWIFKMQQ